MRDAEGERQLEISRVVFAKLLFSNEFIQNQRGFEPSYVFFSNCKAL